jgi:hypothetical protein
MAESVNVLIQQLRHLWIPSSSPLHPFTHGFDLLPHPKSLQITHKFSLRKGFDIPSTSQDRINYGDYFVVNEAHLSIQICKSINSKELLLVPKDVWLDMSQ